MDTIYIISGIGSIQNFNTTNINKLYLDYVYFKRSNWSIQTNYISFHVIYLISIYDEYIKHNSKPSIIIGHSLGELVSLYVSGGITWEKCIDIALIYDERFDKINNDINNMGGLCVVSNITKTDTDIEIACYNTYSSYTLSSLNIENLDKHGKIICNMPFHHSKIKKYFDNLIFNETIINSIPIFKYEILNTIDLDDITKMFHTSVDFIKTINNLFTRYDISKLEFHEIGEKPIIIPLLLKSYSKIKLKNESIVDLNKIYEYVKIYIKTNYSTDDHKISFRELGLKSTDFVLLVDQINFKLGYNLSKIFFYKYPTLDSLKNNFISETKNNDNSEINKIYYINGIHCKFANTNSLFDYWELIKSGKSYIDKPNNHKYEGGYINIDPFDNEYFKIPDAEANTMDPQQTVLLQVVNEALIDAGYTNPFDNLKLKEVGVFIGAWSNDHAIWGDKKNSVYTATSQANSILAARISYLYDFKGPSMTIDTACSSSLVALHTALASLKNGDCEIAIVAGINLVSDEMTDILMKGGFLSNDFRCHTFDDLANGYVRGEGCAAIVISLDSTNSYAKILSTHINQDGKSNGLTAPNPESQVKLINQCIVKANISKEEISFIECHGTGTALGDPIEVDALYDVFGNQKIVLGSIKTQIGHTEAISGLAGLLKLILCLNYKKVPSGITILNLNRFINWQKMNFQLPNHEHILETNIGGVSSYGFGGTNSHVIIQAMNLHKIINKNPIINIMEYEGHKLYDQIIYPACGWLELLDSNLKEITFIKALNTSIKLSDKNIYINYVKSNDNVLFSNIEFNDIYKTISKDQHYTNTIEHGLNYQSIFRCIKEIYISNNIFKVLLDESNYNIGTLDAGLQVVACWNSSRTFIPYKFINFIRLNKNPISYIIGKIITQTNSSIICSINYFDTDNNIVCFIQEVELRLIEYNLPYANWCNKVIKVPNNLLHTDNHIIINEYPKTYDEIGMFIINLAKNTYSNTKYFFKNIPTDINLNGILKTIKLEQPMFDYELENNLILEQCTIIAEPWIYKIRNNKLIKTSLYLRQLKDGETLVKTEFSGVNFRDSLNLLGMYPGDAGNIGIDFAGTIIQSASNKFNIGDKVIGLSFGSYASHLIAKEDLMIKTDLSLDKAAALPLTSITAIYCLEKIGKIKKYDNVLIHAGAGGVGLCAIQYAQWKGANIFSTVSSKEKENYLISIGINKNNIKSSRNSDFKLEWENKFDIILNSLSFVDDSFKCLKTNGIFIEIGKRTLINANTAYNYFPVAIDEMMISNTKILKECFDIMKVKLFNLPTKVLDINIALKELQHGQNIGKYVFKTNISINSNETYIITGGTGSLGKLLIKYLDNKNINYQLLSREDLTTKTILCKKLQTIRKYKQIKCIFHLAGCLSDGLYINQTFDKFKTVLEPKITILKWLDELTREDNLDNFVVYSSVTSYFGSNGQSNYSFANSLMDQLIINRNKNGLCGISLLWGPWKEVGMGTDAENHFEKIGIKSITNNDGMQVLDGILCVKQGVYVLAELNKNMHKNTDTILDSDINIEKILEQVMGLKWYKSLIQKLNYKSLPLMDLGIDSLLSAEIKNEINRLIDINISNTFLFDYPTIDSMINYINNNNLKSDIFDKTNIINKSDTSNELAITGISCRFPMSNNLNEFWSNLISNKDCIGVYNTFGLIDNKDKFDATFFNISEIEANTMDPNHRIILEEVHNALIDADIDIKCTTNKNIGIFIGQSFNDYDILSRNEQISVYSSTANARSILAGRIAFYYDFKGPTMTIDTACSSSLVCLDIAKTYINASKCDKAIVGAVNIILDNKVSEMFMTTNMLSADYKCKTFDNSANGYVRSEGCGVIIVEKLSDAILNNKYIYGVIKGTATNHDGKTATLTAPNGPSQENLYKMALSDSKLQPSDIDYIECHGTATSLGDPIETGSIMNVYRSNRIKPLYLGSVKSNIGHTEPVAGIAGIIKACLIFSYNIIPATIHFKELNTHIKLEPNVFITDKNINITNDFNIAISSFGFSGTNAHVILSSCQNKDKKNNGNPINWNKQHYWISNNDVKLKKTIKL